ncbi:hypothetical protein V6574_29055 [Streptomyces sp. SM1P]
MPSFGAVMTGGSTPASTWKCCSTGGEQPSARSATHWTTCSPGVHSTARRHSHWPAAPTPVPPMYRPCSKKSR